MVVVKYSREEVASHADNSSLWIILNDKVYDVTKFMLEHPGGEEVLLQWAGQDATDSFNDVGHSADARAMTNDYMIGELANKREEAVQPEGTYVEKQESWYEILTSPTWSNFLIPVAMSVGIFVLYKLGTELVRRVSQ